MGSRRLVRDVLLSNQFNFLRQGRQAAGGMPLRLTTINGSFVFRHFSIFNEFSRKVKGEAKGNQEFQQSIKELSEKVGEIKEDLKSRTKDTTERLYKHVDDIWTGAEATTKKVSANAREKISAATDEVKGTLGFGKKEPSGSINSSTNFKDGTDAEFHTSRQTQDSQGSESSNFEKSAGKSETLFGQFKTAVSSASSKLSSAVQKLEAAKVIDLAKNGYSVVENELTGSPAKRRQMQYASTSMSNEERSARKDIVIVPSKQSIWGKKWEAFKVKMTGHPIFKHVSGLSEPVVTKGQELAEDMRERWETSDNPVVHKIQDLNDTVFGETSTALSFKEIRRRDL